MKNKILAGRGRVHVYTGNGKGKTTAALGLALRAIGHNLSVCMVQFLKGGSYFGEVITAKKLQNFNIVQFGEDCPWTKDVEKSIFRCGGCRYCFSIHGDDKKRALDALKFSEEIVKSNKYDVVILDEINMAVSKKLIDVKSVLNLIKNKNPDVELILTGRNAPKRVITAADLVTEMIDVKHPIKVSNTLVGRIGIDY